MTFWPGSTPPAQPCAVSLQVTSNQNTASNQNQENEKSVLLSCLDKPSSPYLYADEQISVELFIHLSTIFILLLIFKRPHCALEQFLDSQTYSRTYQGKPVFTKVFLRGLLKGCLRQKKKKQNMGWFTTWKRALCMMHSEKFLPPIILQRFTKGFYSISHPGFPCHSANLSTQAKFK